MGWQVEPDVNQLMRLMRSAVLRSKATGIGPGHELCEALDALPRAHLRMAVRRSRLVLGLALPSPLVLGALPELLKGFAC